MAAKKAVNLSIDAEVLAAAKAMDINLSLTLEEELRRKLREENIRKFQDEHRAALEAHNDFIDQNGIWSEKFRNW
ncbi:antitoxin CcdA [Rhizomicrobium palustre]|uniref:Antitoxin CcdA n=1 Tax=Rhizomicrobium palustre TaxID=189966 RepID=A0A846N2J3_9PROT|nr:antitoxin CcdA [Rhizomicrobium palustre]